MIQRYIYGVLTSGVEMLANDNTLLRDLFQDDFVLETTEVESIIEYFNEKSLSVINGYARKNTSFPAVAIILGDEGEITNVIGDGAGMIMDVSDPLYGADVDTAIWEHTYYLMIYTEHPDVTAYYYEMVKYILLAGLTTLSNQGLFEFSFSGTELAPDPRYIPEHLFGRQLIFKCQREFQRVDRESKLAKAFQVSGIHLDRSGSPRDVGEVETLVTVMSEDTND
jgi:hypothetical protein